MFYIYLLECADDKSWYIGYSADLKQRIERHQMGEGARTTSRKKNWQLIYYEAYKNQQDAKRCERFLKSGSGRNFLKRQLANYLRATAYDILVLMNGGGERPDRGAGKVFDLSDWQKPEIEKGPSAAPSLGGGVSDEQLRKLPRDQKLKIIQDEYTAWSEKWIEMIDKDLLVNADAVDHAIDNIASLWIQANDLLPGDEVIDREPYDAVSAARERYKKRHGLSD